MKPAVVLDLDETLISSSLFPPPAKYSTEILSSRVENAAAKSNTKENSCVPFRQSCLKDCPVCFTIKHNRRKVYILTRPGLQTFYTNIKNSYDVYFFTSSDKKYAEQIIDFIDPELPKDHIFHREHCTFQYGYSIKDLSILHRNMDEVLLVDDIEGSSLKQPNCLVRISPWSGWLNRPHIRLPSSNLPHYRRKSENDVNFPPSTPSPTSISGQNELSNQHADTDNTSDDDYDDCDDELISHVLPILQNFAQDFQRKNSISMNS